MVTKIRMKYLFTVFEMDFEEFEFLFLEYLRLFCINYKYGCEDTCKKVYSPALKLALRHLPLNI